MSICCKKPFKSEKPHEKLNIYSLVLIQDVSNKQHARRLESNFISRQMSPETVMWDVFPETRGGGCYIHLPLSTSKLENCTYRDWMRNKSRQSNLLINQKGYRLANPVKKHSKLLSFVSHCATGTVTLKLGNHLGSWSLRHMSGLCVLRPYVLGNNKNEALTAKMCVFRELHLNLLISRGTTNIFLEKKFTEEDRHPWQKKMALSKRCFYVSCVWLLSVWGETIILAWVTD